MKEKNRRDEQAGDGAEIGKGKLASRGRRRLVQALSVGGVAAGAAAVPDKWTAPVIDAVTLPAHGQTTGPGGFFGEGALSFADIEAVEQLGEQFLAMQGVQDEVPDLDGLYDALFPTAHAVEPERPDTKDTLLASSSSFGVTQAFLSESDELTARFDLVISSNEDLEVKCEGSVVIPLCFRGGVNSSSYSPLFLINCSGPGSLLIEAIILQRNADDVLIGFRIEESSPDALMLFRGGSAPSCPQCPQEEPVGLDCSAPWMDD